MLQRVLSDIVVTVLHVSLSEALLNEGALTELQLLVETLAHAVAVTLLHKNKLGATGSDRNGEGVAFMRCNHRHAVEGFESGVLLVSGTFRTVLDSVDMVGEIGDEFVEGDCLILIVVGHFDLHCLLSFLGATALHDGLASSGGYFAEGKILGEVANTDCCGAIKGDKAGVLMQMSILFLPVNFAAHIVGAFLEFHLHMLVTSEETQAALDIVYLVGVSRRIIGIIHLDHEEARVRVRIVSATREHPLVLLREGDGVGTCNLDFEVEDSQVTLLNNTRKLPVVNVLAELDATEVLLHVVERHPEQTVVRFLDTALFAQLISP